MQHTAVNLRVSEIFHSIQGETTNAGLPMVFIRLTGCPLRCTYCDTAYAFYGKQVLSIADIYQRINQFKCQDVTITGGEPLAQKGCLPLLQMLADKGYRVFLETSGACSIDKVDTRIGIILDIKTPASGEEKRNVWKNFEVLKPTDQVKVVIKNYQDYQWAKEKIRQLKLVEQGYCVLFSPVHEALAAKELAEWILADGLKVRLQLQIHKYIWQGDSKGR